MWHRFHQRLSHVPTKQMPAEAYRLVATYQLGTPERRYGNITESLLFVLIGLISESVGVILMKSGCIPLITFYFGHEQGKNYNLGFLSTPITITIGNSTHVSLGSYISACWVALALALVFLSIGILLFVHSIKKLLRKSRVYECSKGFLEIEGNDTVVAAMSWDQIVACWHRATGITGFRSEIIFHAYSVEGIDDVKRDITHAGLRKRIERELARFS